MKFHYYLKWLFTRWYLYVLTLFFWFITHDWTSKNISYETITGEIMLSFIMPIIIISMIYSMAKAGRRERTPDMQDYMPRRLKYASFWRRVLASSIDTLIFIPITLILNVSFGFDILTVWILELAIILYYSAYFESSRYQGTLGKIICHIKVTDLQSQKINFDTALWRNILKCLSTIILCIGYFMIAFTEKKQGLHDKIAKCLVIVKD